MPQHGPLSTGSACIRLLTRSSGSTRDDALIGNGRGARGRQTRRGGVRELDLRNPDCSKKTTAKKYKNQHSTAKWRVKSGRGAKSNVIVCWRCSTAAQRNAITRAGGRELS